MAAVKRRGVGRVGRIGNILVDEAQGGKVVTSPGGLVNLSHSV